MHHRDFDARQLQKERLHLHLPDFADALCQPQPLAVVIAKHAFQGAGELLQGVHREGRHIVARVQHQLHLMVVQRLHRALQVGHVVVAIGDNTDSHKPLLRWHGFTSC
ncbi:hypothetical protein HRbin14_01068 [bacterium HR14]|nr:hypothetical protein HRbin14_01068 [bacterium HR14]